MIQCEPPQSKVLPSLCCREHKLLYGLSSIPARRLQAPGVNAQGTDQKGQP
jgi:hypothetical protein